MDKLLAEKFGQHPGLIMWHVSNELGGECYCPLCVERFQKYLSEQFDHEIDKLNQAWWTTFWSHRYNDFDQIDAAFKEAKATKGMPTAIIAHTVKGKGVSFMENQVGWHGTAPNDEQYAVAMEELEKAGEALCQK